MREKRFSSFLLALLLALILTVPGCTVRMGSSGHDSSSWSVSRQAERRIELELPGWDAPVTNNAPIQGTWAAEGAWLDDLGAPSGSNIWIQLQFRTRLDEGKSFVCTTHGIRGAEFRTRPAAQPGGVEYVTKLSTAEVVMRGERSRNRWSGKAEIFPDSAFLRRGGELLEGQLTVGQLLRFGLRPEPLKYVELVCAVSNRWTWSDVLHLCQRGVDPAFISALREPSGNESRPTGATSPPLPSRAPFSADDLVLLHSRGVSAEYVIAADAAGTAFGANELVLLHSRGVAAAFIRDVIASGLNASASDLVLLNSRGVPIRYITDLRAAGYGFNAHDLVLLHSRGVAVSYAEALRAAGYNYTASELVLLHSRGVPSEYLASVANKSYKPLSASEVLRLHAANVPAEMVQRLRK